MGDLTRRLVMVSWLCIQPPTSKREVHVPRPGSCDICYLISWGMAEHVTMTCVDRGAEVLTGVRGLKRDVEIDGESDVRRQ